MPLTRSGLRSPLDPWSRRPPRAGRGAHGSVNIRANGTEEVAEMACTRVTNDPSWWPTRRSRSSWCGWPRPSPPLHGSGCGDGGSGGGASGGTGGASSSSTSSEQHLVGDRRYGWREVVEQHVVEQHVVEQHVVLLLGLRPRNPHMPWASGDQCLQRDLLRRVLLRRAEFELHRGRLVLLGRVLLGRVPPRVLPQRRELHRGLRVLQRHVHRRAVHGDVRLRLQRQDLLRPAAMRQLVHHQPLVLGRQHLRLRHPPSPLRPGLQAHRRRLCPRHGRRDLRARAAIATRWGWG